MKTTTATIMNKDNLIKRAKELLRNNSEAYTESVMYAERDNYTSIMDIAKAMETAVKQMTLTPERMKRKN